MREQGLAITTCNIAIRSMNAFCTWLYENGHITENFKLKQIKEEKKAISGYTDEEIKKIFLLIRAVGLRRRCRLKPVDWILITKCLRCRAKAVKSVSYHLASN
jgi:site-specific recombinase XerD